ncbi:MAG: ROK family protein [Betaproteobacteria bacterium]|nr:ROK family protein [Betaproteobacteria bacterium]
MAIGLDLGGTKTEIIALGPDGAELLRHRIPTPQGDYDATLDAIVHLVREAERELGTHATVGIGTPGAISAATGFIKNSNSTCLNGRPLKADLEARLGRTLRIANDANCFALSEAVDGAAAGAKVVFGVILGTGVGGGIVVDGKILTGANAIAGEWGHNPLPVLDAAELPGPACYCGRSGCIETWLSGPGLARDYRQATGRVLEAREIAERATQDAQCEAALARYEERLARALAQVVNILDPDVIVLGGGLSNIERLYRNVPRLWARHVFSDTIATRLTRNRHGDSSGVRGAAWLGAEGTPRYWQRRLRS